MSYLSKKEWKLLKFEKAKRSGKMYSAVLENRKTKKKRTMHFGDNKMMNYQDKTGLNLYPHLIHSDKERRKRFHSRHRGFVKEGYYSPSYFSLTYLW